VSVLPTVYAWSKFVVTLRSKTDDEFSEDFVVQLQCHNPEARNPLYLGFVEDELVAAIVVNTPPGSKWANGAEYSWIALYCESFETCAYRIVEHLAIGLVDMKLHPEGATSVPHYHKIPEPYYYDVHNWRPT